MNSELPTGALPLKTQLERTETLNGRTTTHIMTTLRFPTLSCGKDLTLCGGPGWSMWLLV